MDTMDYDVICIGGGAASFFAALQFKSRCPDRSCAIIERGKSLLQKVKISGGGRCNVTNVITDPFQLSEHYPRGQKALIGPFNTWSTQDTVQWFESRGVAIKAEPDGRMFPVTNDSATIVDCLIGEARQLGVVIITRENITDFNHIEAEDRWQVDGQQQTYRCTRLFMGTGSNARIWQLLQAKGVKIVDPVPSLFTFNIKDPLIKNLPGLSVPRATVTIPSAKMSAEGPLLITHWGLSGPAILRLSAWGARQLANCDYKFEIHVDWLSGQDTMSQLFHLQKSSPTKCIKNTPLAPLPSRLWLSFLTAANIDPEKRWAEVSKKAISHLSDRLSRYPFHVNGKSTFKEEFVTAGGVALKGVDFKAFNARAYPSLYFAGEVLDIDGITGGFNFQAAWTGGYIAGTHMAASMSD